MVAARLGVRRGQTMRRVRAGAVAALAAVLASGCGTVCNLATGKPEVYGGVEKDVECLLTPTQTPVMTAQSGQGGAAILAAFLVAEGTLSLVGDTLTLPLVLYMRHD